jgi:hypothetical protein
MIHELIKAAIHLSCCDSFTFLVSLIMQRMDARSTTMFQKDDISCRQRQSLFLQIDVFNLFTSLQRSYIPILSLMSEATTNKHTSCTSVLQRTSTGKHSIAELSLYKMHK